MDENENVDGMYLKDLIEESLFNQYQEFGSLKLGTEEHLLAAKALSEQGKMWTEMNRVELEFNEKTAQRESDERVKREQMADQRKSNTKGLLITGLFGLAQTVLTLVSYDKWYNTGMEFEQTGTITSHTFGNFWKSRKPNKL